MDSLLVVFGPAYTASAEYPVYIANNPSLCLTLDTWWVARPSSYVEYQFAQVFHSTMTIDMSDVLQCPSSFACQLYASGDWCVSNCSTCGASCAAVRVVDRSNLAYYQTSRCVVLFGTLYVTGVPSVTDFELNSAFLTVTTIRGDLVIAGNPTVTSLAAFANLQSVDNVVLQGNAQLVDARLPNANILGSISVTNNPRLCPQRWPQSAAADAPCAAVDVTQLVVIWAANVSVAVASLSQRMVHVPFAEGQVCQAQLARHSLTAALR